MSRVGLSNLVNIAYASPDPQRSDRIVNEFVRAYLAKRDLDRLDAAESASGWLRDKLQAVGPKAQVVSAAYPPVDNSRGLFVIAGAGITGGFTGIFAALVIAFFDRRIRTPEQLTALVSKPCLGLVAVSRDKKPGQALSFLSAAEQPFSPLWSTPRAVGAALQRTSTGITLRMVGVVSTFEGTGTTSIAADLAIMSAAAGRKVLLVDA